MTISERPAEADDRAEPGHWEGVAELTGLLPHLEEQLGAAAAVARRGADVRAQ